jgi:hypothetical protein
VNVFKQTGADEQILRPPSGLNRFLVQAEFGDGFLRRVELSLLLVVVEDARGGTDVFGIRVRCRASFVEELAETVSLAQQAEIARNQFRRPQRLKRFLVNRQALLQGSLPVLDQRFRFHWENIVGGELLLIGGDQLVGRGVVSLREQKLEEAGI